MSFLPNKSIIFILFFPFIFFIQTSNAMDTGLDLEEDSFLRKRKILREEGNEYYDSFFSAKRKPLSLPLDLSNNQTFEKFTKAFCLEQEKVKTSFKRVILSNNFLCGCSLEFMYYIISFIGHCSSINLSLNNFGSNGDVFIGILEYLKRCPHLEELDLSNNSLNLLSDAQLDQALFILSQFETLKEVNLEINNFSDQQLIIIQSYP